MSKLHIACLLSPMADTEGPMDIEGGKVLTGAKKIMGKYGEVGLEATITYGEENPDAIRADLLTVGKEKEVKDLQQTAIATIQPAKFPGELGVHALHDEDIDQKDGFAVADLLVGMIEKLDSKPDLIFAGRESWDYSHGVVGPAVAQKLGLPYYSGVNEIKLNDDMKSVTATFIAGNDKLIYDIALPAVFGTTDWLNGKDSARFTSLKGVMMAKKFKRNMVDMSTDAASRTTIDEITPVKTERKNRKLAGDEGDAMAKQIADILMTEDKVLSLDSSGGGDDSGAQAADWSSADSVDMSDSVVVVAEHDGKTIRLSTLQALSQARVVADAMDKKVTVAIFANEVGKMGGELSAHGADRVVAVEADAFKNATLEAYVKALQALGQPACLMTVASDMGRDLAAYMASAYGSGLLQDAVALSVDGDAFKAKRIVSNARFETNERILASGTPVMSLRASAFDPIEADASTEFVKVAVGDDLSGGASLKSVDAGEKTAGVPLNEAKVIVSGGRGMKAAENFEKLHNMADLLGAAVGASRAVTDLEWVPHNLQIGQTGTTVAPDVYFAVGISGAIQHLTGMLGSKYIVAINPDEDAPIHKHADLSVIDKWENIVPNLTEAFKKAQA